MIDNECERSARPPSADVVKLFLRQDDVIELMKTAGEYEQLKVRFNALVNEFNQICENMDVLTERTIRDAVALGRYRSAVYYALGLIDDSIEGGGTVTTGDRNRVQEAINKADEMVDEMTELKPAGGY